MAVAILGVTLSGCSDGGASSTTSTPQTQTPGTPSTVPSSQPSRDDFETPLNFTELVHDGEYGKADELVTPGSPADRYVAHQRKYAEAQEGATYGMEELPGHEVAGDRPSGFSYRRSGSRAF
jgi:hypothetical protein